MPPIPILIGAAVIDSINPCAFGVLIFLLAYLIKTSKSKNKLLIHGLVYIFAVFLTYLLAGILLLPIISGLGRLSLSLYAIIGSLVILAGLLELKDFFWYGKGPSLTLLPGASKRIKMYANRISGNISSAFLLGVFVALVELPCTGAVYLAILSVMSLSGVDAATVGWLIVYNIIFVLPLIVILFAFYKGLSAEKIEEWRKENRAWMRLAIGFVLLFLGAWMIHTALF
jgi:cytochrome c biogenesis protein CcdA